MSNPYTNWYVETYRDIWPELDEKLVPRWMSYRTDNNFPFFIKDDLDYAYLLGHVSQWIPITAIPLWILKRWRKSNNGVK